MNTNWLVRVGRSRFVRACVLLGAWIDGAPRHGAIDRWEVHAAMLRTKLWWNGWYYELG